MTFLNASIFLAVLLDTKEAGECQMMLTKIERGKLTAVTSTHVLEEVAFKLLIAKASEIIQTKKNIWEIRERLKSEGKIRQECYKVLSGFIEYIKILCLKGR